MHALANKSLDWNAIPALPATRMDKSAADQQDLADIRAVLGGEQDQFARIIARHQAALGNYLWRFSRIRAERDQLVHDTFVDAYFSLSKYRGDAPFFFWLRAIATRVVYHHWKRQHRQVARGEVDIAPYAETLVGDPGIRPMDERAELLHAALARLRPKDRMLLVLIYIEGMSTREAAQTMGTSETVVRVRSHRARHRLEKELDALMGESGHGA